MTRARSSCARRRRGQKIRSGPRWWGGACQCQCMCMWQWVCVPGMFSARQTVPHSLLRAPRGLLRCALSSAGTAACQPASDATDRESATCARTPRPGVLWCLYVLTRRRGADTAHTRWDGTHEAPLERSTHTRRESADLHQTGCGAPCWARLLRVLTWADLEPSY